jgi:uncharacterized protein (TIGR02145 family)
MSNIYIPNYEILKVLGEGGMALVYLAEHRLLHNRVALKVLKREFVHNENIRKRFLSEARGMAKMSHPNIVRVTDLIDADDIVAFIMEYIEGESLKEYLDRKGKLNEEEIGGLLEQMLSALEYAHEQGFVHRDIKPSNFMVSPQGKLKLLDFGIAKQTNTASAEYTITGTNHLLGTAIYMSPEQIHETKSVNPRSDIYSLGVVLWQMVTGKKPYSTETLSAFQLQTKIVNEPLPLTGTNWDNLIQIATEKDAQNRYADINSFRSAWKKGQNISNERRDSGEKTVIEQLTRQSYDKILQGHSEISGENSLIGFVRIGNQEWQTKNLNVDRFRNGDLIQEARSKKEWVAAGENEVPVWCYYDNDLKNDKIYGKLYNWFAVNDARGLAPEGWHIPADYEWTTLTDYLGGKEMAGGKMKAIETIYWAEPNKGATNYSGFSAFPGGYRDYNGSFYNISYNAFFWSTNENGSNHAWYLHLHNNIVNVYRKTFEKQVGASVRCIRD